MAKRLPRRVLNPKLFATVRRCGRPRTRLALIAGYSHPTTFYEHMRASTVPGSALQVSRLERLADAVNFPRDQIFLD